MAHNSNNQNFLINCELLLIHICNLSKGKMKNCVATTKYLAKAIGKSERQVYRYLKELKEHYLIETETGKLKTTKFRKKYRLRKIIPTCEKPKNSREILAIYFDIEVSKEEKKEITKFILKNHMSDNSIKVQEEKVEEVTETTIKKPIEAIIEEYNVVFSFPKKDYDIIAEMDKWEAIEEAKKKKRKAEELGVSEAEITTLNLPKLTWNPEFSQTKEERAEIYKLITEDEAKLSRARKLRSFLKETYGDLEDISEPELIKEYKGYLDIIRKLENGEE